MECKHFNSLALGFFVCKNVLEKFLLFGILAEQL